MGFFSNFFQSTIGKVITIAAAVAITAFTGGAAAGLFGLAEGAGGFIAAAAGLSGAAAAAVGLAGSLVAAALVTSALLSRSPTDPLAGTNMSLQDVLGTRQLSGAQTSNSLPWVVGNAYISGQVFDTVLSTDQQTIWYALAISEVGSSQTFAYDLQKTYWGDKLVNFDGTDATKVASLVDNAGTTDTKIAGNVFMYFYTNGSSSGQNTSQTAIQIMNDAKIPAANRWASTNTMYQTAFVIIKIIYNQTAGVTGLVTPKFRLTSNAPYQKPGTIWYEYMTNTRFGMGFPAAQVDLISANTWDAYADQVITYTPAAGGSATQARYRLNGVLDTKQRFRANLDLLMANADCFFRFDEINNKWKVIPNAAGTSVFSFNDNNIIGAFTFSPKNLKDTYTSAVISFPDAAIRDQQNNVYLSVPSTLLTPNVPYNPLNLTYALTTDSIQAQYLANRILEQSQEDLIIQFNASYNAAGIEAGDIVDVTNSTYGWTGKLFRVAEVREQMDDSFGLSVNLLCVEYNAAVYDNFSITQFTPAANTNIADPTFFGTLVAPTVSNSMPITAVPSFLLTGTVPAAGISNELDFFYGTSNDPLASKLLQALPNPQSTGYAPSSTLAITVTGLPAATYYFFTRAKNSIGTSAFSAASSSFAWNPQPTGSTSGVSINPNWNPAAILVPANSSNVATTVGQTAQLSVYLGASLLNFSASASDTGMANNTWRVDVATISSGLTLTGPVAGATTATWTVSAMTVNAATLNVSIRYKDNAGVVTAAGSTIVGFTEVVQAAAGATATLNYNALILQQNADGSYPTTAQNIVFTLISGNTTLTKTQPVSLNSSTGNISYGTPSGDASITITTTGAGSNVSGTVNFLQTSSGISLTSSILINKNVPVTTFFVVYQRSSTTAPETRPATPSGGVIDTYNNVVITPPTGWSINPPAGTNVLYQATTTLTYIRQVGTYGIGLVSWTTPQQSSQTLPNGARYSWDINGSTYTPVRVSFDIFRLLTTSTTAPATPTGGAVAIASSVGSLTAPSGWTQQVNQNTYDLEYKSSTVVFTTSDNTSYTPTWSAPLLSFLPPGTIANTTINRIGVQPATVPSPTSAELTGVYNRSLPQFGDAVVIKYAGPPITYVSFTYDGTNWNQATSFIKGDQVVSGTITANQIAAQTIIGNNIAANTIAGTNIQASTITSDKLLVSQLSAISANAGTLTAGTITGTTSLVVGSSPVRNGLTMTGTGAEFNVSGNGDFAIGNATNSLVFDGTTLQVNGSLIATGNIKAKAVDATKILIDNATVIAGAAQDLQVGKISSGQVVPGGTTVTYRSTAIGTTQSTLTIYQWSSVPDTGFNAGNATVLLPITFTISGYVFLYPTSYVQLNFTWQGDSSPGGGTNIAGSMQYKSNGTYTETISGVVPSLYNRSSTSKIIFSIFNINATPGTLTVTPQSGVMVTWNAITNPAPSTKTIIQYPGFNTYP